MSAALALRRAELVRRMNTLPDEVSEWVARVQMPEHELHWSQVSALDALMKVFFSRQKAISDELQAGPDATTYEQRLFDLLNAIVASQRAWSFFREKLDLRLDAKLKESLRVADIVSIDCYDIAINAAVSQGLVAASNVREPPLTYLSADFSPLTWVRGSRPNDGRVEDLSGQLLPIPVIELPWDQIENPWEFLAIHHEVTHDIDADLKLRPQLTASLTAALEPMAPEQRRRWTSWIGEIVADLLALQFAGPAFAEMLLNFLMLAPSTVTTLTAGDTHPNHYVRVLLAVAYIRSMADKAAEADFAERLRVHASKIEQLWKGLYGETAGTLQPYVEACGTVIDALMDRRLAALGDKPLRDLVPYTAQQDAAIREAANLMATAQPVAFQMAPRHVISAARLAVTAAASAGARPEQFDQIAATARALVKWPGGRRAITDFDVVDPDRRRKDLAELAADAIIRRSAEGFGGGVT